MMILGIIGIVCLMYYVACGIYAGFTASYLWIWLVGGLLCVAAALFLHYKGAHNLTFTMPKAIKYILITVGILIAALFAFVEAHIAACMFQTGEPNLKYVIVLGAQVKNNGPSQALAHRIDKAYEYLTENKDTTAILSGGQGNDEPMSEAQCMAEELEKMGISKDRLILEDKSTNTEENFRFSTELLEDPQQEFGVITSNFHVFRAEGIAYKQLGHKVVGIAAESHDIMLPHYMVREFLAILKDTLTGHMKW